MCIVLVLFYFKKHSKHLCVCLYDSEKAIRKIHNCQLIQITLGGRNGGAPPGDKLFLYTF